MVTSSPPLGHDAGRVRSRLSAMSTISRVAAISKFSGLVKAFALSCESSSPSRIWRRSSRRCAVMPSAPASTASSAAFRGRDACRPRVADGRDVIDVDAEAELGHAATQMRDMTARPDSRFLMKT